VETRSPVVSSDTRGAGFTNEGGIDGTNRFLHNVMGLWLLSESLRVWALDGSTTNLDRLLVAAGEVPDWGPVIDADDPVFLPPGDIPARITQACLTSGQRAPEDRPSMVRCILDSLAAAYARTL